MALSSVSRGCLMDLVDLPMLLDLLVLLDLGGIGPGIGGKGTACRARLSGSNREECSTDELYVNLTRGQRRKHDQKKRGNAKPIHQMSELFSPNTTESPGQERGDHQTGEDPALLSKE
ncbi:hypothetical protein ACOMHN_009767 [Nucella lapillus]